MIKFIDEKIYGFLSKHQLSYFTIQKFRFFKMLLQNNTIPINQENSTNSVNSDNRTHKQTTESFYKNILFYLLKQQPDFDQKNDLFQSLLNMSELELRTVTNIDFTGYFNRFLVKLECEIYCYLNSSNIINYITYLI